MGVDIFEDRYENRAATNEEFQKARENCMTAEQIRRADFYTSKWFDQRSSIAEDVEEWERIENLCGGEREENGSGRTEAYVNVITPNTEGQVASLTNYNIAATLRGRGVSDERFKKTAEPIIDFILKHNDIRSLVKKTGRKYIRLGNTWTTVGWNPEAYDGMGAPEIKVKMLTEVLPDKKVRDASRLSDCDFIIEEAGQFSILWAEREYGEKYADAIQTGNATADFKESYELDDNASFTLLRIWTKMNETGNLQLILMSACGVVLEESEEDAPYYSTVFNQYPCFYAGLYPVEGRFYHFGDGRLLAPIQELINKLYDEIVLACQFASQGLTFVDPRAKLNPDEYAERDPSKPLFVRAPNTNVMVSKGQGINSVIYDLLNQLFQQVQEVTRFSTLMTGQQGASRTATESNILMQQGATGVDDKKGDLSKMLSDAVLYAFALCLENWTAEVALRVSDNEDDFVWIDPRQLLNVPQMVPATEQYKKDWKAMNPKAPKHRVPKWMNLEVDGGEDDLDATPEEVADEEGVVQKVYPKKKVTATNQIKLDLSLSIGEGMPNNKVSMYNILLSLSQLTVIDEQTMQPTPLMTRQKVVDMLEDILGIHIDTDEDGTITANGQRLSKPASQGGIVPPINTSQNVQGASLNNSLAGVTA